MPEESLSVPTHVAIIPDGNRRWAKKLGLKPWEGHIKGIGDLAENVAWTAFDEGVKYLTVWGGSYDNLTKRSKVEIRMLNEAYRLFIKKILQDPKVPEKEINVKFLGEWRKVLEPKTIELIDEVEAFTKNNKSNYFTVLAAYNGDREMVNAINRFSADGGKKIDPKVLKSYLWTAELPPVDLVIRTGVEKDPHVSAGFMMWDTRYSQLYFTDKLWPDFTKDDLKNALGDFSSRQRRLGK